MCGSGLGFAVNANKFIGIYAEDCHDIHSAERARLGNITKIITMGAQIIGPNIEKRISQERLANAG